VSDQLATKQDLAAAVAPLASKQDLAELRAETNRDLAEAEQRIIEKLTEAIRDAQTEVLRAFYNGARPIEMRLNRVDEVATRLAWVEERLAALERGKFPSAG
jgi:RecJ-like exonuclease